MKWSRVMTNEALNRLAGHAQKHFFVVAGNIGSGKTTLTQKLAQRLGWKPFFESVSDNPYLEDFYKDMGRWSFNLQIFFLTHRFNTHKIIENSPFSAIQDRSIYEDAHIFARALFETGELSERDYESYQRLYLSMNEFIGPPSMMIFLKRSVPRLMERIRLRGRDFEKSISPDYIARLNHYYEDWYSSYTRGKALIIDTDDLDFLENDDHFNQLINRIVDCLDQRDLFLHY